jgi:hypothetical protein
MSFRLWTIFYVFALAAAAMATFGPGGGSFAAILVLGFWAWVLYGPKQRPTAIATLIAVFIVLILIGLLLPAVQSARPAARRNQCMNQLKQIAIGVLNYYDVNKAFPPAFVTDANGEPMHSWRVLILPYVEEAVLHRKYNFNEPWNGPNNSKLAGQIPLVFRCPSHDGETGANALETQYFAIVSPKTIWPESAARTYRDISDGTANTIMVIEASGLGINWMEPRDVTLDEAVELLTTKPRSGHMHVDDGFLMTTYYETSYRNVAFCDAHAVWMGQLKDAELAKTLLMAADGKTIPADWQETYVEPNATTVVKWGKVWGLSLFMVLSLLPAAWLKRQRTTVSRATEIAVVDAAEQEVGVTADATGAI